MDYDAMTRRVLARVREYEDQKKKRRKTTLRVGVPALCVLILAVGIGAAQARLQTPAPETALSVEEPEEPFIPLEGPAPGIEPNDAAPEMLHIPEIELPDPQEGMETDMIGLLVYRGGIYTEAQSYLGKDAQKIERNLVHDSLGTAKGNIDEWSAQTDLATEFASTCVGEVYPVLYYSPEFRLAVVNEMTLDDGTTVPWIWFMERLNGIDLGLGADLFEERLRLTGRIASARFQTHDDWNEAGNNYQPMDDVEAAERLIEAACAGQFEYVYDTQPNFYSREGKQVHLFLTLADGTVTELRLFEGGWVGYQPLGWYFVHIPGEAFDAVFDACE